MAALTPAIIALSAGAARLGRRLGHELHGLRARIDDADVLFDDVVEHTATLFAAGRPIVGICAAGILIRAVAPLLGDKHGEPALIAISEDGRHVVPLLGGHHGANRLARELAGRLGATAAVTTAGDTAFGVAVDEPPAGWRLANQGDAKAAMATMLAAGGALIEGDLPWLKALPAADGVRLQATTAPVCGSARRLVFHPQKLALGVGCSRGCPPDELAALVETSLAEAGLAKGALAAIGTLDLKADEPAIAALARSMDVPLRLFAAGELEALTSRLANPSDRVFAEVGCHGVAEAAALALAGDDARLTITKRKSATATCAVATASSPIVAPPGRKPGSVRLIGIGPGQADWRTPEASRLIASADELVGYELYLELLGPLARHKPVHRFALGRETERCRFALERAAEGFDVALICSGDAGIYAMGALLFELLDRAPGLSDGARRVEVLSVPGISALQAAAARAGAPLGHDFCAISLSDLMTTWSVIERRIMAAGSGDFVIAFYNPVSQRRRHQLARAKEMLLQHRPATTPVLLAANLGRPQERLGLRTLATLEVDEVDMLTIVLVGSSESRIVERGFGPAFYTPRGYRQRVLQEV